jgi:hypothetical protein
MTLFGVREFKAFLSKKANSFRYEFAVRMRARRFAECASGCDACDVVDAR